MTHSTTTSTGSQVSILPAVKADDRSMLNRLAAQLAHAERRSGSSPRVKAA